MRGAVATDDGLRTTRVETEAPPPVACAKIRRQP